MHSAFGPPQAVDERGRKNRSVFVPRPVHEAEFDVVQPGGKRREGRPTKLTNAKFKRILELIKSGITIMSAVRIEGIHYQTWRNHLQRKPDWQRLADEAELIREEVWKAEALEMVRAAFPKNWVAAMTFLERRWPNEYALRVVNRNINSDEAVLNKVSPEQLAEDIRLARVVAEERPQLGNGSSQSDDAFERCN